MSNSVPTHLLPLHQAFAGPDEPDGTRHSELGSQFVAAGYKLTVGASSTVNVNCKMGPGSRLGGRGIPRR